jgi:hypothetical protein
VRRREDLYHGPFVERAPDVVAVCAPRFGIIFESLGRELRDQRALRPLRGARLHGHARPARHLPARGSAIAAPAERGELPIEAVTPAILHLLDVPVPRDLGAARAAGVFRAEYLRAHPCASATPSRPRPPATPGWRSEEDEARIADHLRALGYLE